ncbi:conserved hypothetical protein [Leishmania mexicana MHOM/GT/2001/U1103]|uniref:Uncharacterized protein n=1 Tax=Leishmania mexicana (strain MHOM/GT/2001/U1103) TaxID=929439 RepID=E9AZY4_LEIMU|nr:conserved hypothetical protein [Leishmania mexicana MHOM/GT/2001/U1103]CBZ28535.1 conserved hypothetical protein [Leishmania mexicana MHOM/GT/2001/U1103]
MGGAPSRETLVRHIVRGPRVRGSAAPTVGHSTSLGANNAGEPLTDMPTAASQQPEIILIPLIPDYFPSSASPLFQQLLHVRREVNVAYYYRDARSMAAEHTVVRDQIGSDKDIYNWYMSLSEQRLLETDNELIALSRAGRVVSPVPCAVAFVYEASTTATVAAAGGAVMSTTDTPSLGSNIGGGKKKSGRNSRVHRHGKVSGSSASNGYMTMENTVRLPHYNLRVRIFGFVGDTRFCPPSMHHSQAAKLPMCLTIFLSKSAGGNHRAQVTLLAAYTYITQLQAIGILRPHEEASLVGGGVVQGAATRAGVKADAAGNVADPLAALRLTATNGAGSAAAAYRDPYLDPYGANLPAAADPYAIADDDGSNDVEWRRHSPPHMTSSVPRDGLKIHLEGLGTMITSVAADVAKETVLRRPIEILMHRADVPALCYLRELRARIDQSSACATPAVSEKKGKAPAPLSCAKPISTAATITSLSHGASGEEDCGGDIGVAPANSNASLRQSCAPNESRMSKTMDANSSISAVAMRPGGDAAEVGSESLKYQIRTVVRADELRGSVAADSIGRILLWASRFYTGHFEQLMGGEAAKLRQGLAQRNLTESPLDGTLLLTDEEPRPPRVTPKLGDVWIPSNEAYVEVHDTEHEGDGWAKVAAGTVLRYATSAPSTSSTPAPGAFWRVSPNEFAEDILLSLCRQACQASRRALPTDSHWLLSGKTGVPEGLGMGLLVWRELCAGQVVFYGTTPEFLKKWIQSGADVEQAYRNHIKRSHSSKEPTSAVETESGGAAAARDDDAVAGGQSLSMSVTVTTAASSGLHSSYEGNFPSNPSVASDGLDKSGSSDSRRDKGSGTSSMEFYSAHTGFVSTAVQAKAILSPTAPTARGNQADDSAKPKRVRTDDQPRKPSSSTPPVAVGHLAQSQNVSGTPRKDARQGRVAPAQQGLQLALPVGSSTSMALWTHSSSTVGTPNSHTGVSLASVSMGSRSSSASLSYRQPSQRRSPAAAATTCWIGVPESAPAGNADAPTVNVVVRQRRSVRTTPSCSATVGTTPLRASQINDSPHHFHTPRDVPSMPFVGAQPSVVGTASEASAEYSVQATDSAVIQPCGSPPVRIPGRWGPSEDDSHRQGGHSPASAERGRYPRAEEELLPHSCTLNNATALVDARGPPPQRSAAMTIRGGYGTGSIASTPQQAATPAKWSTSSAAQPSSMRGTSITFASGSASSAHARHAPLLHSIRYTEPCQPVSSTRSSSLSTGELFWSSCCSNASPTYRKGSLRPPPLDTVGADVGSMHALQHTPVLQFSADPVRRGCGDVSPAGRAAVATALMTGTLRPGGDATIVPFSGDSSAAHTPGQGDLVNSAKNSVGSGKYRWDWRGVSWPV